MINCRRRDSYLGSARASRAHFGASPKCSGIKVREGEGAIGPRRTGSHSSEWLGIFSLFLDLKPNECGSL
jgi:hypothetical protein